MDAQIFWNVIGIYNQQTVAVQIVLFLFAVITAVLSYSHKVKWAAKFALGIIHLFIGIALRGMEWNLFKNTLRSHYTCFVAFCFCMKAGITGMIHLKNLMAGNVCC